MVKVSVIVVIVAINSLIFLSLAKAAGRADRDLKKSTKHVSFERRKQGVGISTVTNKYSNKDLNKQSHLDRDLKSCMKCKFFWGNNHQCSLKRCYKEKKKPVIQNTVKKSECDGCTYRQSDRYCFPCMKKLFEKK